MADYKLKKLIGAHTIPQLPSVLKDLAIDGPLLLVADDRTFGIAGQAVKETLVAAGYQLRECILRRDGQLHADEGALGEVLVKMDAGIQLLLAVGSGSITDITRFVAAKFGKPFLAVPTAPSMDGYASSVAALTIRGFKQTLPAAAPAALVADGGILAGAPPLMIQAGFGDLLGKYTSLADWKIGSLIQEEGYSEEIAALVRSALARTEAGLDAGITSAAFIESLTDALVISGEAMQLWGNSRPASGAEHHLAHFWEMQAALAGQPSHLHGTKVGVAVILAAGVYHRLFRMERREVEALLAQYRPETESENAARIQKAYGPLAGDVLADLNGYYLDAGQRTLRQRRIVENWDLMRNWVRTNVPAPEQIRELMRRAGAPVDPAQIHVDGKLLKLAMQNAKEVRARYTVFRLADDIGWTDHFND